MKPKFWNADKIVSLSAILISLATMTIYLYQTHLIQKQQDASVMPYLMISTSLSQKHFVVNLSNNGLGPAMIEKVNVYYKNKMYEDVDLPTFFLKSNPNKKDSLIMKGIGYSNIGKGQLIPSGNIISILEVNNNRDKAILMNNYFWEINQPVELEITFTSIYGEKWSVRGMESRPQKIED
jgi:hypothetical protein